MHRQLAVVPIERSKAKWPWFKRHLLLIVSSLLLAVLLVVVSVVGLGHSFELVMSAADAVGNVGAIAPERAATADRGVTVAGGASSVTEGSGPPRTPTEMGGGASALPSVERQGAVAGQGVGGSSGTSGSSSMTESTGAGGSGGAQAAEAVAQSGGSEGAASATGEAGSAPSAWNEAVQGALSLLSQRTISMCGSNTCNTGQVCCNASCGICVAPGQTCDQRQCANAPRTPTVVLCGRGQCNDGQVCCNASCGICAAPGASCSDQECR